MSASLVVPRPHCGAPHRIVMFPYAGAGAASYYPWLDGFDKTIEVGIIRLPAREARLDELAVRSIEVAVADILQQLGQYDGRTMVFFGHSLGALLAYETCRALAERGLTLPSLLIVSGRSAPQLPMRRDPIHALSRDEFFQRLQALGGMPEEILAMPELMDYMEPVLRADLEINDRYCHAHLEPLDVPIVALAGSEDHDFPEEDLWGWRAQTTAAFHLHTFEGGHFFINEHRKGVIALIQLYVARYCKVVACPVSDESYL